MQYFNIMKLKQTLVTKCCNEDPGTCTKSKQMAHQVSLGGTKFLPCFVHGCSFNQPSYEIQTTGRVCFQDLCRGDCSAWTRPKGTRVEERLEHAGIDASKNKRRVKGRRPMCQETVCTSHCNVRSQPDWHV